MRKTIKMLEERVASLEKYLEWWKTRFDEFKRASEETEKRLATEKALNETLRQKAERPVPVLLWCPSCGMRHVDRAGLAPHRTHACQGCGMLWRPANVHTVGVAFLDGTKDGGTT